MVTVALASAMIILIKNITLIYSLWVIGAALAALAEL